MAGIDEGIQPADAAPPLVLAIDVGTSSARALVYDGRARRVQGWEVHQPYPVLTTQQGGVYVDANELLALTAGCIDAILRRVGDGPVAAVAFDTFWHSVLGVDVDGHPVTPVYLWADTQSRAAAEELCRELDAEAIHARTGCVLHSSYWPAKLRWLSQTQPDMVRRAARWMSFAEYFYLHLFGSARVSTSMASGTGLLDVHTCSWDADVLTALRVDEDELSTLSEFSDVMRGLQGSYAARWPALRDLPWYLALGDGGCNNIGSGGSSPDRWVAMVGTSGAIRAVIETERFTVPPGLFTYRVDRRRIVQGGALSDGGNVFAWLQHTLLFPTLAQLEVELAGMQPAAHGLTVLPFLAGERSPHWNPEARAAFVGISLATRPADIVRASLEAVAFQFGIVHDAMKGALPPAKGIIGSGAGLIHSPAWLQIMTDVLGEPVIVSAVPEASSRGAALLVLENMGAIAGVEDVPAPLGMKYAPIPQHTAIYREAMAGQQRLYDLLIGP